MLNYIWGGLIILSLLFAVGNDVSDYLDDTYQNGEERQVQLLFYRSDNQKSFDAQLVWQADTLAVSIRPLSNEIRFTQSESLPVFLNQVWINSRAKESEPFRAKILKWQPDSHEALIVFPEVHFVKLKAITQAAFDTATTAVELAIGLIGIMAFWLGLMQIAEKSGLIESVVKVVQPVLHFLFPDVPKNHPALGAISLNLAANMLGLGNAATPLGIKAMEDLQQLNDEKDTATDAMIMFLTINTASVQLVPPVTLIALLGIGLGELLPAIIITTVISLIVGITTAKWYARRNKRKAAGV